ncbi:MAG: anion permease, partial [Hymenobacteraceae bacterium]|nr:anion permease [Hymenobacteraceae bacterium]MDX5395086.1 anion permease [Hymenobacteraceae bacterium]MDX5511124.1 anion permease [Hymenobacteraceae bacterium]
QNVYGTDLTKKHFRILNVIRNEEKFMPDYRTSIMENDVLLVEGELEQLLKVKETKGIQIMADVIMDEELEKGDLRLAELLITPNSNLIGHTIRKIDFNVRYGLMVLAVSRNGESIRSKIGSVQLRLGDLLLIQGPADRLEVLHTNSNFALLDEYEAVLFKKRKGLITLLTFIAAIVLGSTGILPLSISFLGAAVISVLFRCISPEKAYDAIDWRLLILIGGMTAFGTAMETTHAADFLANGIVYLLKPLGIISILAGFILLTVFLTQPMSNAAAALVILPVALHTATALDVNPRTFAIAIMLSASVSLITPFEPACILVYGPGKYRFLDFIKIGSGLTIILLAIILFTVPYFWPF